MRVSDLNVGDKVDYRELIDSPISVWGCIVQHVEPMPNDYGFPVAWVRGVSGVVAVDHLSHSKSEKVAPLPYQALGDNGPPK